MACAARSRATPPMADKPLMMYDVRIDARRPVTEADVAAFEALLVCYGQLRRYISQIEAEHRRMVANVRAAADALEKRAKEIA